MRKRSWGKITLTVMLAALLMLGSPMTVPSVWALGDDTVTEAAQEAQPVVDSMAEEGEPTPAGETAESTGEAEAAEGIASSDQRGTAEGNIDSAESGDTAAPGAEMESGLPEESAESGESVESAETEITDAEEVTGEEPEPEAMEGAEEEPPEDPGEELSSIETVVNGSGTLELSREEAAAGDEIQVTAVPAEGYYLAQIRISYPVPVEGSEASGEITEGVAEGGTGEEGGAEGSGEGTSDTTGEEPETELTFETLTVSGSGAAFLMKDVPVTVYADFIAITWDGTIDLTWYDAADSTIQIRYPAQLAGAAALCNGLFNDMPTRQADGDTAAMIPDLIDAEGNAVGLTGSSAAGFVAANDGSGYQVFADVDGDGIPTTVVGDLSLLKIYHGSGEVGSNNQVTTSIYWYGDEDYTGKTILLDADLNMGGVLADGSRKTVFANWSGPNYMPIGGQYSMDRTNGYTRLTAGFNGTFNGQGHMVYNVYVSRHADTFGNCQAVGLIGLLGINRVESGTVSKPGVYNVAVDGFIHGNRSIGGIVGKTAHSKGSVIRNCMNFATIYNTDAKGCGGIVGAGWYEPSYGDGQLRVENCANFGFVCTGYNKNAGGLIGSSEAMAFDCYTIGYSAGEGRGNENAGQALGTNNGGAVWYNCYTVAGAGSCTRNEPGTATPYVYNTTYGSAIRVLDTPQELRADLLNGKVRNDGTDAFGYMDSDEDVILNAKRNWVTGAESGTVEFISPHLAESLRSVVSWHNPDVTFSKYTQQDLASSLTQVNATGMPIPRSFIRDGAAITEFRYTGTPTMEYLTGETFDTGDHENQSESPYDADASKEFSVWAVFDDGTWQELEDYTVTYEGGISEFQNAGENQSVTVSGTYLGRSYSTTITGINVTECELLSMRITEQPVNTFYCAHEAFDPEGMTVTTEYGVRGEDGAEDTVSMTIKMTVSEGKYSYVKQVLDTSLSDQQHRYKTIAMTEEAAKAYEYVIGGSDLDEGVTEVPVVHRFHGEELSCTVPVTVIGSEAPRLWKDGENEREVVYIETAGDFLWFANQVSTGANPAMEAELLNDITLSSSLLPVGVHTRGTRTTTVVYTGTFNGNGHTVTLQLSRPNSYSGLFYSIGTGGRVDELTVEGTISGGSYVGGIACCLDGGSISRCTNRAVMIGSGSYVGGIVGSIRMADSTLVHCSNEGKVTGAGYVGGIAGLARGQNVVLENCHNSGAVAAIGTQNPAGGIAGSFEGEGAAIRLSGNTGSVALNPESAVTSARAGGLAGYFGKGTIESSRNTGNVSGSTGAWLGGLTGQATAYSVLQNCYTTGNVTLEDPSEDGAAGGLSGSLAKNTTVQRCYQAGEVTTGGTADDFERLGGFSGIVPDGMKNVTKATVLVLGSGEGAEDTVWTEISGEALKTAAAALGDEFFDRTDCYPALTWEEDGHLLVPGTLHTTQSSSCTESGQAYQYEQECAVCHTGYGEQTTIALEPKHHPGSAVVENRIAGTCTEGGRHDEVIYCKDCGAELSRRTVSDPSYGHQAGSAVTEVVMEPTCTEPGVSAEVIYCKVCGAELQREEFETPVIEHTPGEAVREHALSVAASRPASYESVIYCSVCGEELSRTVVTGPSAPTGVKAVAASYSSVKVSWSKVAGASSYEVWQKIGTAGWRKITTTTATSVTRTGLTTGTKDSYIIRAIGTNGLSSKNSATVAATPALAKTTVKATAGSRKITITWSKVAGASGYVVYRSASKNGTYTAVKTITSGSTVKFVNTKLKKGKIWYYKVRPYRTIGSTRVYGPLSDVKYAKVK
ncbi:MAG: hypothetical protein IJH77_04295 [Mogibacterium sp.]|nr:hypothetical protein [Mogibacterium sp.]